LQCKRTQEAVIVRLDRTIQYAAASRFYHWRRSLLDHRPSRVMTLKVWRDCMQHIRHCERSEAIHGAASGEVDCFAESVIGRAFARPVDDGTCLRDLARMFLREVFIYFPPSEF
jgi:hypothetical protein